MTKRTIATKWDLPVGKDKTGALIQIYFTCPYCHSDDYQMIFTGANNLDKFESDFESDQVCGICGKKVIIECRKLR